MAEIAYKNIGLLPDDLCEINSLLQSKNKTDLTVEDIWFLMDRVWDSLNCDNQKPEDKAVSEFYRHPVWLLNGLFIENDLQSIQNRKDISTWISGHKNIYNIQSLIDYGGGFGTLAKLIIQQTPSLTIDILEPYPHHYTTLKLSGMKQISIIKTTSRIYDCLVCTDVLEHVSDPLSTLSTMIKAVRINGILIIANSFYPQIKCHLPGTFHLRFTFNFFTRLMGLKKIGQCGKSNAFAYQKVSHKITPWSILRSFERISIFLFPIFIFIQTTYKFLKQVLYMLCKLTTNNIDAPSGSIFKK